MKKNIYALVDCDNFYVSCERIFRPDLENKPVAVLSNNDGCIVARSNEVKSLGIKMGTPYFKIMDTIVENDIQIFSSNYALYSDISNRIVSTLKEFSPNIEIYSIDEAFIQLLLPEDKCLKYGKRVRERILQNIGVPTTIGIAYTKTLTKIASKIAKKDPQYGGVLSLLDIEKNDKYLEKVNVEDIWGVGRKYSKKLQSINIYTAKELKYANQKRIRKTMTVNGLRTVLELNNTECISIDMTPSTKKSIVDSKSFGESTESLTDVKQALAINVARAGEKLRKQNTVTSFLTVFILTNPFKTPYYSKSIGIKLPYPLSDTSSLIKYTFIGLEKIFKKGYRYKKSGVILTDIHPSKNVQFNFQVEEHLKHLNKYENISSSIDLINQKWGRDTIKIASMGINSNTIMKQERKSPRYTTSWEEMLNVKI